ncbi:hypothetical protein PpBr36_07565 [Pyricularia pennisetigena]|uniref:hypothetical protein n=1 Tax=Pyricularia pennisetigena TaxID=1578925 RepID=UPI0011516F0F|nr:hypothetical protein PpBr36_07565 [Pyricularia pennisetigena]TLS25220.1 hypothetical protein PpBr36_07565 [Pyricularia pennisetigena]
MATPNQQNLAEKNDEYAKNFTQGHLELPPAKKYLPPGLEASGLAVDPFDLAAHDAAADKVEPRVHGPVVPAAAATARKRLAVMHAVAEPAKRAVAGRLVRPPVGAAHALEEAEVEPHPERVAVQRQRHGLPRRPGGVSELKISYRPLRRPRGAAAWLLLAGVGVQSIGSGSGLGEPGYGGGGSSSSSYLS